MIVYTQWLVDQANTNVGTKLSKGGQEVHKSKSHEYFLVSWKLNEYLSSSYISTNLSTSFYLITYGSLFTNYLPSIYVNTIVFCFDKIVLS